MHRNVVLGELTELRFAIAATEHGWLVSRPIFKDGMYDFLIDRGGRVLKVQVKTANRKRGRPKSGPRFDVTYAHSRSARYKKSDVDFFAVYCCECFYIAPFRSIRLVRNEAVSRILSYRDNWDFKEVV